MGEQSDRAARLLLTYRDALVGLAGRLLIAESLDGADVREAISGSEEVAAEAVATWEGMPERVDLPQWTIAA